MLEKIKKKHGHPKRFDLVGPVQVKSPTREVIIPHVPDIVKVPKSTYAYAFHISEQAPIELYLNELERVKAYQKIPRKVGVSLFFKNKNCMASSKDFGPGLSCVQNCICEVGQQKLICSRNQE